MEYIYAALLLHYGKQPITEDNVMKVLQAAGIQIDEIKVKALISAIKEINIEDIIKTSTLIPTAVPVTSTPTTQPQPEAKPVETKAEEKKVEEKKEEVSEEQIAAGLAGLFG